MPETIEIITPLVVPVSKKKTISLNLNIYRNLHFQQKNKAKIAFKNAIAQQVADIPKLYKVEIEYKLFHKTRRKCDISNVCCIVDKFLCDALIDLGKLEDDNFDYIKKITYLYGGHDPENPRCEVTIKRLIYANN